MDPRTEVHSFFLIRIYGQTALFFNEIANCHFLFPSFEKVFEQNVL